VVLRDLDDDDDAVLCIGQPAHAWVAGQLAAAWGNGLFAEPRPREEVVLAATQHDLGMAEWDAAPQLNSKTGWPRSFLEMPVETHLRLWTAAPRLALSQSRWVALLVAMHGEHLYARRAGEPSVDEFLADLRAFAAAMRTSLRVSEDEAARAQRLLAAWDWMSLVLCRDALPATVEFERPLRMERAGEGAVTVSPWPFRREELSVHFDAQRLAGRFEDDDSLREALRVAPWQRVDVRLSPA
jgi:hypothetical protein